MNTTETKSVSTEYSAVAATLGMKDNFEVKDVVAKISELMKVEATLVSTQKELTDAQTVIAGKEATIKNLQKDNDEKSATIKTYKDKEAEEERLRIEQLVEASFQSGKIDK